MKTKCRNWKGLLCVLCTFAMCLMIPMRAEADELLARIGEMKEAEQKKPELVMAKVKESVNIRESASQEAEKMGVLYKDCGGYVLEQQDGWSMIKSGNVKGWVKNDYLYFGEEAKKLAEDVGKLVATSVTQTLRVRKEPSLESDILGLVGMGEPMEAMENDGEWVSVNWEGLTGYVSAEYVEVDFIIGEAETMEEIKEREAREAEAKRKVQKEAIMATADEATVLAALIQCEAGGESYEGQVAVGSVVMNRVRSSRFPNTIKEVVYAPGQFTPANSTKMTNLVLGGNIYQSCRQAAAEVLSGYCNVGDCLFFRRAGNKEGLIIGNHVFY